MKKIFSILCVIFTVLMCSGVAGATTLDFESAVTSGSPFGEIQDGYGGLNWDNFYALNAPALYSGSGYVNGLVSGDWVAYNYNALVGAVNHSPFTFNSA